MSKQYSKVLDSFKKLESFQYKKVLTHEEISKFSIEKANIIKKYKNLFSPSVNDEFDSLGIIPHKEKLETIKNLKSEKIVVEIDGKKMEKAINVFIEPTKGEVKQVSVEKGIRKVNDKDVDSYRVFFTICWVFLFGKNGKCECFDDFKNIKVIPSKLSYTKDKYEFIGYVKSGIEKIEKITNEQNEVQYKCKKVKILSKIGSRKDAFLVEVLE